MSQAGFTIKSVINVGGRYVAITDRQRSQVYLNAGDKVRLFSPASDSIEFRIPRLVHFAPVSPSDMLMFELPAVQRRDLEAWTGGRAG
ncbi:MAG: hypothetical protein JNL98_06820 [Bryobacterales bacterium]|nr:hypothetical protein [Bryobacterales bacterium]